ncbi:MAG: class I SAM-dependent methyltransferase [Candidatus Omnitrophica bacterium]|nr:class I SAM-dependent methyltransferase [Candidatus Omnitrophota bacterium]
MKKYSDSIEERLTGRHKKCMEFCGDIKDKKILNIGCYNGWFEKFAIENGCLEIIGIDTNEDNLVNVKTQVKDKRAKFFKASILDLSQFGTNYFDLVTMFDVLEHLPKNKETIALSEIKRVLKSDGKLVISTPNNSLFSKILDPAWYLGHRHYSKDSIVKIFSEAGLKLKKIDYGGGFHELFSMILLYFFKWGFKREIPFKSWFERKREEEYLNNNGFVTLFVRANK